MKHSTKHTAGIVLQSLFTGLIIFTLSSAAWGQLPQAHIIVDEPAWYHSAPNLCNPETQMCYYADLGMSLTRGYAPFPVFFQGWSSTPRENIVEWSWDFGAGAEGDAGGRSFSGFNAAHIFESPGTYTVRLRVKDSTNIWSTYDSSMITVMPRNGLTYYVDTAIGNDNYDGQCMTVSGNCGPWKTATKAFSRMVRPSNNAPLSQWNYKPGDQILFKRGQSFDMSVSVTINHGWGTQGYYFGTYGNASDPKPIVQWKGLPNVFMINATGIGTGYIGFADLQFNFLGTNGQATGLYSIANGTKNVFFLRDDFFEPYNGAVGVSINQWYDEMSSGIFIVGCTIQNPTTNATAVGQIFTFGVNCYALLYNTFDKSGNHISYNSYVDKAVIAGNVFSRPPFGRTALRIIGGDDTTREANNIYIADNKFLGWIDPVTVGAPHNVSTRYNYNLINFAPGGNTGVKLINNVVFERNVLTNFECAMNLVNVENCIVRNNLFISPSPNIFAYVTLSDNTGGLNGASGLTRPLKNIKIIGNTFVSNSPTNNPAGRPFIRVYSWPYGPSLYGGSSKHQNIEVKNNIFSAVPGRNVMAIWLVDTANSLPAQFRSDHNLMYVPGAAAGQLFSVCANSHTLNSWQSLTGNDQNSLTADPQFVTPVAALTHAPGAPSGVQALAEANGYISSLQLDITSPAIDNGAPLLTGLYYDFNGANRPQGAGFDIGAFEFNSNSTAIENVYDDKSVMVFPNPSHGQFKIEFDLNAKSQIIICNTLGETIYNAEIQQGKKEVNISGFANGIYMLKVFNNEQQQYVRIVKQ